MELSSWLASGFDFVWSMGVAIQLLNPVINIDWIFSFWGIVCDMMNSMKIEKLVDLRESLKQFNRV